MVMLIPSVPSLIPDITDLFQIFGLLFINLLQKTFFYFFAISMFSIYLYL